MVALFQYWVQTMCVVTGLTSTRRTTGTGAGKVLRSGRCARDADIFCFEIHRDMFDKLVATRIEDESLKLFLVCPMVGPF